MFLHKSIKNPPVIANFDCSDTEDIWLFTATGMMWNFSLCLCVWIDLCFIAAIKVYSCSSASEWREDSDPLNWQLTMGSAVHCATVQSATPSSRADVYQQIFVVQALILMDIYIIDVSQGKMSYLLIAKPRQSKS